MICVTWNILKRWTQNQRRLGKTSQESSDCKVSIFKIPICMKKCLNALPSEEKSLYSACLKQLFLLPLWSSKDLEVTSITAMEVTLFGLYFPQPFTEGTVLQPDRKTEVTNMFRMQGAHQTDCTDGQAYPCTILFSFIYI